MFTQGGIIFGIVIALILGCFFGVAIWNSEAHTISKIIIHLMIIAFFFFVPAICMSVEDKNWNDGKCIRCEIKYVPFGKGRRGQTYYYCPNCLTEITK